MSNTAGPDFDTAGRAREAFFEFMLYERRSGGYGSSDHNAPQSGGMSGVDEGVTTAYVTERVAVSALCAWLK